MKYIRRGFSILLLLFIGVLVCRNFVPDAFAQVAEIGVENIEETNRDSSLFLTLIYPVVGGVFFFMILGFIIYLLENNKNQKQLLKNQSLLMGNVESLTKTMLEQRQLSYTTSFFAQLPIIYQNFYDSVLKIVSYSFFFPERFKHENADLFSFCRVFLTEISKNPEMVIKIRQTFKKNEKIQLEMAMLQIRYERFVKALKVYDRDQFVYQYINDGVFGEVMDILIKAYEDVKTQHVSELQEAKEEESEEAESLLDSLKF